MLYNFLFYSLISIFFSSLYLKRDKCLASGGIILYVIISVMWLWLVLVFREPAGDPRRYINIFNSIAELDFIDLFGYHDLPFGFALLNWVSALICTDAVFYLTITYCFCLVPLYFAFRERFDRVDASILMMLYLLYPFYLSGLGNVIKQGIASGFMLWGMTCLLDRDDPREIKGILLISISVLFHSAFWISVVAIVTWFLFYRKKHLNWALGTLLVCILMAATEVNEVVFDFIVPREVVEQLGFGIYLDSEYRLNGRVILLGYITGFRLDFAIFTVAPLIVVLYFAFKSGVIVNNEMVKVYCLLSSSYFLLCYIPYADRLAAFSWVIIPYFIYFSLSKSIFKGFLNYIVIMAVFFHAILMLDYNKEYFQWLPF